ncbi:MAG: hypothetical protein U0517_03050 [Candidatus Andersenbacteria bacterium]
MAYVVGLMASDGCLSPDGRHLFFTSNNLDLIQTLKKCLAIKNRVSKKKSGFTGRSNGYQLQFGDVTFYRFLLSIGLTPRKSRTLGKLSIPPNFFADFLRGLFDGDGTVYAYWDPRWRSSFMFYVAFATASAQFAKWLVKATQQTIGAKGHVTSGSGAYQAKFSKHEARKILTAFYQDSASPHLARKKQKALAILWEDPYPAGYCASGATG